MDDPKTEQQRRRGLSRRHFFNSMATGATEAAILAIPAKAAAQPGTAQSGDGGLVNAVLNINGQNHALLLEPRWTLQYVLRERLGLMENKQGCERGECGACTVLMDGVARYACMTLALEAEGAKITTLTGLMQGEELGTVQQAFVEEDAFQCGYCTPGQVVSAEALLRTTPDPTLEQIREAMSGNLCRCGTYQHIFKAVQRAAELKKGGR
ncbi:MAG: (2Fe-2S)-binding protein [Bryobacteraceae bacterium]